MSNTLPWVYPIGFYCTKCHNTGYKIKNGRSCKSCWKQFAHQPNVNYIPPPPVIEESGFRIPFTTMKINDDFSVTDTYLKPTYVQATPVYYTMPPQPQFYPVQQPRPPPLPPTQQHQGSPTSKSDDPPSYEEITQTQNYPSYPQPQDYTPRPPQGYYSSYQLAPRVVNPGDPSLGGVLCGTCRGRGTNYSFWRDEDTTCQTCQGVGRILKNTYNI